MTSLPSNRTPAKAPVSRTGLFARIMGVVTLVYWALLPTGLLLPMITGFGEHANPFHLILGLMLLMVTSVLMGPRLEASPRWPMWHLALVAVFVAFLMISSIDPITSREPIFVRYGIYGLAIVGGLSASVIARKMGPDVIGAFVTAFCVSLLIYAAFWLIQLPDMIARAMGDWTFAFWPFGNIRTVAIYFLPAVVGAVILAGSTDVRRLGGLYLLAGTVGMTFLFWTGSRGPLLAVFLSFGAVAWLQPPADRRRFVITAISVIVVASLLSLLLPRMNASYGFWQRLLETFFGEEPDVLTGRGSVWAYTLEKIAARPWTGYGMGSYLSHPDAEDAWRRHAHNDVLQMWHDFGIIGGSAGVALVLTVAFNGIAGRRPGVQSLACVGMVASLLFVAMVDTVLVYIQSFTFLCLLLGLLSGQARPEVGAEARGSMR